MTGNEDRALGVDEFAFHFETETGIDAQRLGTFLQRAGKVAQDAGAELRVVGLHEGSLDVVARVMKSAKSRTVRGFSEDAIDIMSEGNLTRRVIKYIANSMAPEHRSATPVAKAGAEIVKKGGASSISLVHQGGNVLVMDPYIAEEIDRRAREQPSRPSAIPDFSEIAELIGSGESLTGVIGKMHGELFFIPDGYRYAVPVDVNHSPAIDQIYPEARYSIRGRLIMKRDRPDAIEIWSAERLW